MDYGRELYLDSANIDEIREFVQSSAISGVTTNPSLMAKESKGSYASKVEVIGDIIQSYATQVKHLSVEVIGSTYDEMIREALQLKKLMVQFPVVDLYVKIPVTFDNLKVISTLRQEDINVNATACMTANQAQLASMAGARIVSFFYNRMIDGNINPKAMFPEVQKVDAKILAKNEIRVFAESSKKYPIEFNSEYARVICGSIRKVSDVNDCWNSGAEIVTASAKIIKEMLLHPKTDEAIKQFEEDISKWLK